MEREKAVSGRRVTIKDVAAACGVHNGTVSRALEGSPLVAAATRERIVAAAERLGYRRDPVLRALVAYRKGVAAAGYHGTIAWLLTDQHSNPQLLRRLTGYRQASDAFAATLGYRIEEVRADGRGMRRLVRQLAARGIRGVIFPPQLKAGTEVDIDLTGLSAVRIGTSLAAPALHMAAPAQFRNMRKLVEVLRARGCQRIGMWIPRAFDDRAYGQHSGGFWRAQQEIPQAQRVPIGFPDEWDRSHFLAWLDEHRPDVVIGLRDPLHYWMQQTGRDRIPLAWCGDFAYEDMAYPGIEENWLLIYRAGLRMLDGMLRHGETGIPEHPRQLLIEGTWKERP